MGKIDDMDMKILAELVRDSSQSVPKLGKKIKVNPSVVYSRIKRLVKRGLIKRFTVEVSEETLGYAVSSMIGLNIDAKLREKILEEMLALKEVRQVLEVTGRFDIIVSVMSKSLDDLHGIITGRIGKINGVMHSETFIEMKKLVKEPTFELPK